MNSIIRITAAVNQVSVGNPDACLQEVLEILSQAPSLDSDITVFPTLALCSPSCGSLFFNPALLAQSSAALLALQKHTQDLPGYVIAGLVVQDWGASISAMAVLHRGELIALIPTRDNLPPLQNGNYSNAFLPAQTVFACGGLRFCVLGADPSNLAAPVAEAAALGCDLLIVPSYAPMYAGLQDEICATAKALSASTGCAIALVNGGVGDTSSPYLYNGFTAIFESGECLARQTGGEASFFSTADLDMDVIRAQKRTTAYTAPLHQIQPHSNSPKSRLLRPVRRNPFLPAENQAAYLAELYQFQVRSLAARMQNIGISRLVVGVSGGVDSTSTLLASVGAMDLLGLPRENILGVAMPGPGTSTRTAQNAQRLMRTLGVSVRSIPIGVATQQHLKDIGHSGTADTTFENAQARERAQILLDLANMLPAIVVGTGDLSEEALGFCTFAGDHIANYNVNVCITKGVLRALLQYQITDGVFPALQDAVADILDTPVSPELLPIQDGKQLQQTEVILGSYDLHEFFLYHFVKYRMRPCKIFQYACAAFGDTFAPAYIKDRLAFFIGRFCAAQFKRACAPDSASITAVNLNGCNYFIPSDLDPSFLLEDIVGIPLDEQAD